jgi:putative ABC transport system permease protein
MELDGRNQNFDRYDRSMKISAVFATGGVEDTFIFMRLSAMEEMTEESDILDLFEASIMEQSDELKLTADRVKEANPMIEARIVTRVSTSEERVLSKLNALVYLVTIVVLTLTMICVATTMMTVVLERRREIGLKKALGADNRKIAREFLAEGLLLGIVGGFIGSISGLFFARAVAVSVFGRALGAEFHLIPITVVISALVTVAACLFPVLRAVDVEPAVVLKGE